MIDAVIFGSGVDGAGGKRRHIRIITVSRRVILRSRHGGTITADIHRIRGDLQRIGVRIVQRLLIVICGHISHGCLVACGFPEIHADQLIAGGLIGFVLIGFGSSGRHRHEPEDHGRRQEGSQTPLHLFSHIRFSSVFCRSGLLIRAFAPCFCAALLLRLCVSFN